MTVSPVAVTVSPVQQLANKLTSAQAVNLQTMPVQQISGSLANNTALNLYKISLQQGEFLALDVDPGSALGVTLGGLSTSNLTILDSAGNTLATAAASPEPDTGVVSNNAALGFRAATAGTYYVQVSTTATNGGAYLLNMQGTELASMQTGDQLQKTGSMYAFLNGNVLDFAGPTGYGFGIRGTWAEKLTAVKGNKYLTSATYSASGNIFLETAFGEVQMAVPTGQSFTVTTKNNTWAGAVGEVSSMGANIGIPLDNFALDLRQKLGLTMNSISLSSSFTIQLGSTITAQRGITQVLNAVPYLVYAGKGAMNLQFGGISVTNSATTGTTILADPTDPMIYVHVGNYTVAGSLNAHINYTPTQTPSVALSKIYGNVFAAGDFPFANLPFNIEGDVTLNLDANQDGLWLGGEENASQLFQHNSINADALDKVFADLQMGSNGQFNFGYDLDDFHLSVTLGQSSCVYDGPQQHMWFKGGSVDPWAGTPLDNLQMVNIVTFEGSVYGKPSAQNGESPVVGGARTGHVDQFFVQAVDTYKIFGVTADMTLTLDDEGVSTEAKVRALGSDVDLKGSIYRNGDFSLTGEANPNFGPLSGHADFTLAKIGSTESFTTEMSATAGFSSDGISASVTLSGMLTISVNSSGKVTYSGSLDASGDAKLATGSVGFDVDAEVTNNQIVFSIPHLGKEKITLPTL